MSGDRLAQVAWSQEGLQSPPPIDFQAAPGDVIKQLSVLVATGCGFRRAG